MHCCAHVIQFSLLALFKGDPKMGFTFLAISFKTLHLFFLDMRSLPAFAKVDALVPLGSLIAFLRFFLHITSENAFYGALIFPWCGTGLLHKTSEVPLVLSQFLC